MTERTEFCDLILGHRLLCHRGHRGRRRARHRDRDAARSCPLSELRRDREDEGPLRVVIRDLPVFGRRAKLVWSKRRFFCPECDCPQATWTEASNELPTRQVLSARAGRECTRAVGEEARSVASLARMRISAPRHHCPRHH
jgi:hypothetical protein